MTDAHSGKNSLLQQIESLPENSGLPPVHLWNPPFCGDIDIRISRDGQWFYQGSPIGREAMVRLFSTVLRYDEDHCFYLVTPVEKVRIQVDDAPFIATSLTVKPGDSGQILTFTTNVGDNAELGKDHPLWLAPDKQSGFMQPYILVRDRLKALIHRNVFYELVELAEERIINGQKQLIVSSNNHSFSLGSLENHE